MYPSDVLSEVFQTLRLRSDLYFTVHLGRDYSIAIPEEGKRIRFHLVREGGCWITDMEGANPTRLGPGDLAIIPNGAGHILTDDPKRKPAPLSEIVSAENPDPVSGIMIYGQGEPTTNVLCGFCAFDEDLKHPLIDAFQDRLILTTEATSDWPSLGATIQLLSEEAGLADVGMSGITSRLLEIVLIQAMRFLSNQHGLDQPQFMIALADQNLSIALRLIHSQPAQPWTTAMLAQKAGMSRTRFSVRFSVVVGDTPMSYLSNWRLSRARLMMRDTNLSIDEIGRRCGYRSLPAFSRRFKAVFDEGPGAFRRKLRNSTTKDLH